MSSHHCFDILLLASPLDWKFTESAAAFVANICNRNMQKQSLLTFVNVNVGKDNEMLIQLIKHIMCFNFKCSNRILLHCYENV